MLKRLKIYHLEQGRYTDFDEFSDCVVCAYNKKDAKSIHPEDGKVSADIL